MVLRMYRSRTQKTHVPKWISYVPKSSCTESVHPFVPKLSCTESDVTPLRAHLHIDIILPYLPDHDHHHPTTTEQLTVLHCQRVTTCLVAVTTADLPASCLTQTVSEH